MKKQPVVESADDDMGLAVDPLLPAAWDVEAHHQWQTANPRSEPDLTQPRPELHEPATPPDDRLFVVVAYLPNGIEGIVAYQREDGVWLPLMMSTKPRIAYCRKIVTDDKGFGEPVAARINAKLDICQIKPAEYARWTKQAIQESIDQESEPDPDTSVTDVADEPAAKGKRWAPKKPSGGKRKAKLQDGQP